MDDTLAFVSIPFEIFILLNYLSIVQVRVAFSSALSEEVVFLSILFGWGSIFIGFKGAKVGSSVRTDALTKIGKILVLYTMVAN